MTLNRTICRSKIPSNTFTLFEAYTTLHLTRTFHIQALII